MTDHLRFRVFATQPRKPATAHAVAVKEFSGTAFAFAHDSSINDHTHHVLLCALEKDES
jgi:hypothetical protein